MFRGKGKGPVSEGKKGFVGIKAAASAVTITDELLTKVNGYALQPLTSDDVFIGKQILAHNGIDRDRERFPNDLLDLFADTLPGKSTLYFHNRRGTLPLGLYFDALTEDISPEQFKALTGDDISLPAGVKTAKVLWAWYYVVKTDEVDWILKNINGGTYRHWSISFNAADIVAVKQDANGPVLYSEYVGPGEALEGSLVWLGAQPGASSQKSAKDTANHFEGENTMKKLKQLLTRVLGKSFGDDATEDQIADAVEKALGEKDTKITELTEQVAGLKANADLGEKFLDSLAADHARMKALLGECEETDDGKTKLKAFAKGLGVDYLETENKHLQRRVEEKYPNGQLDADDPNKNRGSKGADDNPLIPAE